MNARCFRQSVRTAGGADFACRSLARRVQPVHQQRRVVKDVVVAYRRAAAGPLAKYAGRTEVL